MTPKLFNFGLMLHFILLMFGLNATTYALEAQTVTEADIEQRMQSIKDKQSMADELKNRLLAAYQESIDNLRELENQEDLAQELRGKTANAQLELKLIQRQITDAEDQLKNRKPEKFASIPIDELEQRQVIEKTRLSDLDAEIARTEISITDLTNSPLVIREKIVHLKTKRLSTQQERQLFSGKNGESLQEIEAKQLQLDTRLRLIDSTLKALELESIGNPLRLQIQKERLQLMNLQRERLTLSIAELENHLLERRQQEIDKEQAELLQAEKEAEGKHELIRTAAKDNMDYSRSLREVNKRVEQYLAKKNEIDKRNAALENDFKSAEQKINLAGLSPALGDLLREQRRNLPQRKQYSDLSEAIQREIASTSLEMFKLDEVKKQLADVSMTMQTRMQQELGPKSKPEETLRIRTELRMLLNDQKDLVGRLASAYSEYSRLLGDVDFALQQLLNNSDRFGAYLDQRLLWVPDAPVITQAYLQNIVSSMQWFGSPANWGKVISNVSSGVERYPIVIVPGLAVIVFFLRFRSSLRKESAQLLQKSRANQYLAGFNQTLLNLTYILLLSLPIPLLMAWLAWIVSLGHSSDGFNRAFVMGLLSAAVSWGLLQFFYRLFKPEGIAESFFHWHQRTPQLLFRQIKWARFVIVPCVFIVGMAGVNVIGEHSQTLGRTAQIVLMMAMSYIMHVLTHPTKGVGKNFYSYSTSWVSSLRYVWYLLAVLAPWVVIGFTVAGYYQSALELQSKLIATLRLVFITALFHALVVRWLTITKRQLAVENARKKRKLAAEQANVNVGGEGAFIVEEELLDLSKINQQSNKLLVTMITVILLVGCLMIWSDILPAFSVFDQVELWQYSEVIDGKETLLPVTLINVFFSFFYAGFAFIVVGNFPVLVDLLSAGKFAMTAGGRYALIQLARYLLITIAFLAIANELGGSWAQVQWLVAALSVGLGFGLQEIFANMVSGIILLFERPIRVGDTITVGDVAGRVCRIQMRATHILDWDGKELVVPNKVFITERFVNWTLTDTTTRLVLMVGVAYGSDVDLVENVLKEAVTSVEAILPDPVPSVILLNFGDSSLDFRVTAYVRELGDRMTVTHELHKQFYKMLKIHDIEIPFPQRDIHIRSVVDGKMPI